MKTFGAFLLAGAMILAMVAALYLFGSADLPKPEQGGGSGSESGSSVQLPEVSSQPPVERTPSAAEPPVSGPEPEESELPDSISGEDQAAALGLLMGKLDWSDLKYLAGLQSGEIAEAELSALYEKYAGRFTEEERAQLQALYEKYAHLLG